MLTANLILLSALKSYVIVGVICCAILPRARHAIAGAINAEAFRRRPAWGLVAYFVGIAALAAVAWPDVMHRAYLNPRAR